MEQILVYHLFLKRLNHYQEMIPEINQKSVGSVKPFPVNPRYLVSENGFVFDTKRSRLSNKSFYKDTEFGSLLPVHFFGKNGEYSGFNMRLPCGKRFFMKLHRAVAITFIPKSESDGDMVAHIDENQIPRNNCRTNLKWSTAAENSMDMISN